jgi:hypothetical protein
MPVGCCGHIRLFRAHLGCSCRGEGRGRHLGTALRLTLLAPDIVEAVLNGSLPEKATLPALLERLPNGWNRQRSLFRLQS